MNATQAARAGPGDRLPDLRLVALALATWLSALAALHTRTPVAVAAGGAALLGAGLLVRRAGPAGRRLRWAGILAAVLLGVACGSLATGARLAARDAEPVAAPARERAVVTVELTVRRDPHPLPRRAGRPPSWLVPAWLDRIDPAGRPVRVRARVLVFASDPQWQPLLPGQRVRATGRLGPPRGGDLTAAVLFATGPPERLGEPPWLQRAAGSLRAGLQAASAPLPDEPGGLLPGLAIGDVSALDPTLSDDFRTTGLSHLVAVSGANVS